MMLRVLTICVLLVVSWVREGGTQAPGSNSSFPVISIQGSAARCVALEQVSLGLLYRYEVQNPSTSDAGIAAVGLDLSAPRGLVPRVLATSGRFLADATVNPNARLSHVPVGLRMPGQWSGYISPNGLMEWLSPGVGLAASDPVLPGTHRSDFVLESPYLPGVRAYRLVPDYPYVCCPYNQGDPRNDDLTVREAEDFRVDGRTIAPTFDPSAISLEVVRGELDKVCGLGWIRQGGVCHSLQAKLDAAMRSFNKASRESILRSLLMELEAQHGPQPGKQINDDAYWLLRTNVQYLLSHL